MPYDEDDDEDFELIQHTEQLNGYTVAATFLVFLSNIARCVGGLLFDLGTHAMGHANYTQGERKAIQSTVRDIESLPVTED